MNKQLQDKERVCAACENPVLMKSLKSSIFAYELKNYKTGDFCDQFRQNVDTARPQLDGFDKIMSGMLHSNKATSESSTSDVEPELNDKLHKTTIEEQRIINN